MSQRAAGRGLELQAALDRRETARGPRAICSSVAPAAVAAAAAPSALSTLCAPPSVSVDRRSPSGLTSEKRVTKSVGSMRLAARFAARKSAGRVARRRCTTPAPAACARQYAAYASSALMTAVRSARDPRPSRPRPRATPSRSPKPSRCSAPALVMNPTVGRARRTSCGDVADAVRAHLDHCAAMRGLEAHQRQRHADVIVQVAVRRQARAARARGSRRSFPWRWSCRCCRRRRRPESANSARQRGRQPLQRGQRIGDHDLRQTAPRPAAPPARRPRRARGAAATKSCAVEFGPRSATNSSPAASVRLSLETAPYARSAPTSRAAGRLRRILQGALHAAAPEACATPRSPIAEAARRIVAVDLIVLVPLAGDEHHVAGRGRVASAAAIAAPRSWITRARRAARCRAAIAADDRAGSSERGLSSVTMIWSASCVGDRAHHRPLARIAVAAAAEHAPQLARGSARAARSSAFASASGVWA